MTNNLKHIHDAYLAKREASVTPNAELRAALEEQLFPAQNATRGWFMLPSFAVTVVVLAVLLQRTATPIEVFSPGPAAQHSITDESASDRLFDSGTKDSYYEEPDFIGKDAVPRTAGRPTAELLLDTGEELMEGILGSYCDASMCVDTVALHELLAEGTTFVPVVADTVTLYFVQDVQDIAAGLMTAEGEMLRCAIQIEEISARKYALTLCNDHSGSDVILTVSAWYEDGTDASYIYPLKFE